MTLLHEEAQEVASEHVAWARGVGEQPWRILAALGVPLARPGWDDVHTAVALAWLKMKRQGLVR